MVETFSYVTYAMEHSLGNSHHVEKIFDEYVRRTSDGYFTTWFIVLSTKFVAFYDKFL